MRWIIPFEHITLKDIAEVGGKNASLGELTQELAPHGIAIPAGFALTAAAFREHILHAGLGEHIYQSLDAVDVGNVSDLSKMSAAIRNLVRRATLPKEIAAELLLAYRELSRGYGHDHTDVAVRSVAAHAG